MLVFRSPEKAGKTEYCLANIIMGKFDKRGGGYNSGGKNKNRSGGSGYSGPGHGENHTKDNNHRMRTQKNQGRRQGGGNRYWFITFDSQPRELISFFTD